jgi:hypothetical protein
LQTPNGWFGAQSGGTFAYYSQYVFLPNGSVTGTLGSIATNVLDAASVNVHGNVNMGCNALTNVSMISGCGDAVSVSAGTTRISGDLYLHQQSSVLFGTSGTFRALETSSGLSVSSVSLVLVTP